MNFWYFFGIIALTIFVTRIWLWFYPIHAPNIAGFQLHHYMYGLVLIGLYFLTSNYLILAIGLGLFIDELPLFFTYKGFSWPDNHWPEYHSWKSIWMIATAMILMILIWLGFKPHKP